MEFGLIGEHLTHSYSQKIHARLGDYAYVHRELSPNDLPAFLAQGDFQGLNVTIPYKKAVIPYCAALSEEAQAVGSVNTLLRRADGSLWGHNTDVAGFLYMMDEAGIALAGRKCAILGSGGTSLTAQTALHIRGAREVVVVSRQGPVDYAALTAHHTDTEVLINTTPVGMYPHNGASPVDLAPLTSLDAVADVIYNPETTALLASARARGLKTASGLSMLVAQAHAAACLFTDSALPASRISEIVCALRQETLNLVLVGMPGSGKTALGRLTAQTLHRPFADCDEEIVRRAGMSIPEIFETQGEAAFRALEAQVVSDLGKQSGLVIATGGGAILRQDNCAYLRQNGRVCLVHRPLAQLSRNGRPLSGSAEALSALWEARQDRYHAVCDYEIENVAAPFEAAAAIVEGFYASACHQRTQPEPPWHP